MVRCWLFARLKPCWSIDYTTPQLPAAEPVKGLRGRGRRFGLDSMRPMFATPTATNCHSPVIMVLVSCGADPNCAGQPSELEALRLHTSDRFAGRNGSGRARLFLTREWRLSSDVGQKRTVGCRPRSCRSTKRLTPALATCSALSESRHSMCGRSDRSRSDKIGTMSPCNVIAQEIGEGRVGLGGRPCRLNAGWTTRIGLQSPKTYGRCCNSWSRVSDPRLAAASPRGKRLGAWAPPREPRNGVVSVR
jgi:hypothetical protein